MSNESIVIGKCCLCNASVLANHDYITYSNNEVAHECCNDKAEEYKLDYALENREEDDG